MAADQQQLRGAPWRQEPDQREARPAIARPAWQVSFALATETVWVGVLAFVCALVPPLAVPAFAAAMAHLRRHVAGADDRVAGFVADVRRAAGLWPLSLGVYAVGALVVLNVVLLSGGAVPGGPPALAVVTLAGATGGVVLLRAAAAWSTGEGTAAGRSRRDLVARGARATANDPVGTGLLLVATVLCGVFCWMLLPMVLLVPGLLSLATIAVVHRAAVRTGG